MTADIHKYEHQFFLHNLIYKKNVISYVTFMIFLQNFR